MVDGKVAVVVLKGGVEGEMTLEENDHNEGIEVITYNHNHLKYQVDRMIELQRACVLQKPRKFFIFVHHALLVREPILFSALTWLLAQVQDRSSDDVIEVVAYGIPFEHTDFAFWTSKGGMSYSYARGDKSDERVVAEHVVRAIELGCAKYFSVR